MLQNNFQNIVFVTNNKGFSFPTRTRINSSHYGSLGASPACQMDWLNLSMFKKIGLDPEVSEKSLVRTQDNYGSADPQH